MFGFWRRGTDRTRERALRESRVARSGDDRGPERFPPERDWEVRLWVACKALSSSPEDVMTAISESGTLRDAPWEVASLMLLAERLADEFGLRVSTDIVGDSFTVRFSRASSDGRSAELYPEFHHTE